MKNQSILTLLLLTVITLILSAAHIRSTSDISNPPVVYTIEIKDMITAGTSEHIARAIETASDNNGAALVLRINTPGGLVSATLTILENMLSSNIPIITYVEPSGAIAASAGSFILVGGHIAAMAPGTTCGAAMPVTISFSEEGSGTQTADDKTIKFLSGHLKSISEERGKNSEVIEKFVTENLTLDSKEALEENVIDLIAPSMENLLETADGTILNIHGKEHVLNTSGAEILELEMTWREKATSILGNPQVSFILVIMGFYGLVIGFNAPQTYVPEVFGAIALVLGLYGLGMFEANLFAGLLILLGIGLFIAEAMTPTYGVLTIGGIISLALGAVFLPEEPLMPRSWIRGFVSLAIGFGVGASLFMIIIIRGLLKVKRKRVMQGDEEFTDLDATIMEWSSDGKLGLVKIQGELWKAVTTDGRSFSLGEKVKIISRDGMIVRIDSINPPETDHQS